MLTGEKVFPVHKVRRAGELTMLANAVSSAVERLYAAAPVAGERGQVPRVAAVSAIARLKPAGEEEVDRDAEVREERDRVQHRQALTRGVLAVFEASTYADTLGGSTEAGSSTDDANGRAAPEVTMPDPQLEAAILRFIHTMFRSLDDEEAGAGAGMSITATDKLTGPTAATTESREALSARIESLARRFAEGADDSTNADGTTGVNGVNGANGEEAAKPGDPPRLPASFGGATEATAPAAPDARLQQAYAEVVQALRANLGDGGGQSQTTRAELVSMMQRLALAMQGAPPIDPGLPTRGGLLSARA